MALIRLYEAAAATALYGTESFASATGSGWYMKRHDAVVHHVQNGSMYKIFRDGTAIRCCSSQGYYYYLGYDGDADLMYTIDIFGGYGANRYNNVVGLKADPSTTVPITYTGFSNGIANSFLWHGYYYSISGGTVTKHNMDGSTASTFTVTGSLSFSGDRVSITDDGILVAVDFDNATYGVVRFYNMHTATNLYESTFDRAKVAWIDTVNANIWSINLSTGKMQTWSFLVAPASFSAITMGANRSRYREDNLSVTLRGSNNEPVPNWPVAWSLTTSEGHLEHDYTETDASGVATNKYCGPGVDDYVGASQTIQVSTGY